MNATTTNKRAAKQILGGHLKTGHRWTLQNRPTERNQNKSIYTLRKGAWANTFLGKRSWRAYTGLTWAEGTATQGCDRSADSGAGIMGRRKPPYEQHSGAKAINPRGLGTESPS